MDLDALLAEAAERCHVPGAALAVLADGSVTSAATGVLNMDTGVPVTTDSVFQIGSISKVYTATLIMQLVAEGAFGLDDPVVSVLPDFVLGDASVAQMVTIRHLLSHTSGIDGDHFLDTGRGDDCVGLYVESLAKVGQNHPLGATMSYCNAGFVVLGRIIEVLTGQTWDAALASRLLEPLGLERSMTLPEQAILHRAAVGHLGVPGEQKPTKVWQLMRSCGPAGLIISTASDVIGFARSHLDGTSPWMPSMQEPQVAVPDRWTLGDHWGLGWILFDWDGRPVYGHDGGTIGQSAFLRVVPDAGVAIALLTNGGATTDLYYTVFSSLLSSLAGLEMPARPQPSGEVLADLSPYTGTYEREAARMVIEERDGSLVMTVTSTGPVGKMVEAKPQELTLHVADPSSQLFVTRPPGLDTWAPVVFFTLADGSPYMHFGARATPRVA